MLSLSPQQDTSFYLGLMAQGFEKTKLKVSIKISPLTSHTDQKVPGF
jgi:hypothetical protein